jgi:HAD superfamily hydrolase (TIGR01509 family)
MAFPFTAVIFDLDGLMLDTESISRLSWRKAAQEYERAVSDELFASFIGRRTEDCEAMLRELWGADFPLAELRARIREHWARHVAEHGIPHKPGVAELIDFLETRQIPKAIATSSSKEEARAKMGELAKHFDIVVTGDEVKRGKPAPDIFLLAAARLGVEAPNCLVLEDSLAGMQAAQAAGAYAIMVPDLMPPDEKIRHVCVSLHDVHAWLRDEPEKRP